METNQTPNPRKKKSALSAADEKLRQDHKPMIMHVRREYRLTDPKTGKKTEDIHTRELAREYTIAAVVNQRAGKIAFGCAVCSENDAFDKTKARTISISRALKNPFDVKTLPKEVIELRDVQKAKGKASKAMHTRASKALGKLFTEITHAFPETHTHWFDPDEGARKKMAKQQVVAVKNAVKNKKVTKK